MSKVINKTVGKGSIWTAIDKQFKITKIKKIKGETWVFYKECKNQSEEFGKEYSCYEEAFTARFTEFCNY
jgi:hypothetical protein